jgi:uncharacterized protein (DUF1330 family)
VSQSYHLFLRSFSTDHKFREFTKSAETTSKRHGATVYLAAPLHQCRFLEPGSETGHAWAAQCPSKEALHVLWSDIAASGMIAALDDGRAPQCLAIPNLPSEGLPDPSIPTAANTVSLASTQRLAYMLIEGAVSDQARIDAYRDVILPMIGDRGGYYTIFAFAEDIEILSGSWDHQVFIISRWPDLSVAHDFWLSDRYQTVAIPLRIGAGTFDVMVAEAAEMYGAS